MLTIYLKQDILDLDWKVCSYCLKEIEKFFDSLHQEHINCINREFELQKMSDDGIIQ